MVEEDCSHIVQMPVQGKQTSARLVRPDLDLVVVAARHKERLRVMEIDASHWPVMLLESVDQGAHAVVPELYSRRVKRH